MANTQKVNPDFMKTLQVIAEKHNRFELQTDDFHPVLLIRLDPDNEQCTTELVTEVQVINCHDGVRRMIWNDLAGYMHMTDFDKNIVFIPF